jgi:hypothetical protein
MVQFLTSAERSKKTQGPTERVSSRSASVMTLLCSWSHTGPFANLDCRSALGWTVTTIRAGWLQLAVD